MHSAEILWENDGGFEKGRYSRAHVWRFDGGHEVPGSASPSIVPAPFSDAAAVDPEEAYIAALASCHMLWFLDLARQAGHVVQAYHDHATGALVREDGKMWIPRVDLNIRVKWSGAPPDHASHEALHHRAHEACFIANSVRTEVVTHILET